MMFSMYLCPHSKITMEYLTLAGNTSALHANIAWNAIPIQQNRLYFSMSQNRQWHKIWHNKVIKWFNRNFYLPKGAFNLFKQWLKTSTYSDIYTWICYVRPWRWNYLITWLCYQMIAKPDNKTAAPPWPDPLCIIEDFLTLVNHVNLLRPSDTHMRQWTYHHLFR